MGSLGALWTATSGLLAQSAAIQNISGNVANIQTPAFKRTDTAFDELVYRHQPAESVAWRSVLTNGEAGNVVPGTTSTDMAVAGEGYFTVTGPTGVTSIGQPTFSNSPTTYTRRGDFDLDKNGYLVNGAGNYLMGKQIDPVTKAMSATVQPLQFDMTTERPGLGVLKSISVGTAGQLQGTYSMGQTVDVASLPIATFRGQGFMTQGSGGTFTPTAKSGAAQYDGNGKAVGNFLETSNVDITQETTTMMQAQTAYSASSQVMTAAKEMMQTLTNLTI